jgi:Na+-translocating ferredoxin:NAD+ oxidoreductase RnfD subunit
VPQDQVGVNIGLLVAAVDLLLLVQVLLVGVVLVYRVIIPLDHLLVVVMVAIIRAMMDSQTLEEEEVHLKEISHYLSIT